MAELKEFFINVMVVTIIYWISYKVSGNDKIFMISNFVIFNYLNIKQIRRDVERIKHD